MKRCGLLLIGVIWVNVASLPAWSQSPETVDLLYDPATGRLVADNLRDTPMSVFVVQSKSGIFQVERPDFVTHHHPPEYEARVTKGLYDDVDFGPMVQTGLTPEFLLDDLCVLGYWADGMEINGATVMGQGNLPGEGCGRVFPRNSSGHVTDGLVLLSYHPSSGELSVEIEGETHNGDRALLTALEIISPAEIFTGEPATDLGRLWEVDRDHKLFKLRPEGFGPFSFGNVVASELTHNEIVSDLCVDGAWLGGGRIQAAYQYPDAGSVPFACGGLSAPSQDVVLNYEPETGELMIEVPAELPAGTPGVANAVESERMTTLEIRSRSGLFNPDNAQNLSLQFDQIDAHRILKQSPIGFDRLYLGAVLPTDLSADELAGDLSMDGTMLLGSRLGEIVVTVPEPEGVVLIWAALTLVLPRLRRKGK